MADSTGKTVVYVLGTDRSNMGVDRPAVVLYPMTMEGRVKLRVFADDDDGDYLVTELHNGSFCVEADYDEGRDMFYYWSYKPGTWHWLP